MKKEIEGIKPIIDALVKWRKHIENKEKWEKKE